VTVPYWRRDAKIEIKIKDEVRVPRGLSARTNQSLR
jgi:hypothetical protein